MRKLFVLLIFTLSFTSNAATTIRTNCQADTLNPIPNTCTCDIKVKGEDDYSGFAQFSCDELACEEFESNQQPKECVAGMRGVTCTVAQQTYTCPLLMPRTDASVKTPAVCNVAVADINKNGSLSAYYKYLSFSLCTEFGGSYPPANGWSFTGWFEDGWN